MDAITATTLAGFVCIIWAILGSRLIRLPSQKKRYQKMNDKKLIKYNVQVRLFRNVLVAFTIFVSLALIFVLSTMSDSGFRTYLVCLLIVLLALEVSSFLIFREITKISQSEIKNRERS